MIKYLEESAVRGLISHSIRQSLLQAILAVRGFALVTSANNSTLIKDKINCTLSLNENLRRSRRWERAVPF